MEQILNKDNATQAVAKINCNFEEVERKILGVHGTVKDLFIGTLAPIVNTGVNNPYTCSSSGIAITSPNYTTLSMQSIVGWPHNGMELTFHCPSEYRFVVMSGEIDTRPNPDVVLTSLGAKADGETLAVPATDGFYNVQIKRADGGTMDLQTVQDLVDSGEIRITYEDNEPDVVARNVDCEKYAAACRRSHPQFIEGVIDTRYADLNFYPVITHVSDIHGDAHRLDNALEWSDRNGIDALVNTGDAVQYFWHNGATYLNDISKKHSTRFINVVGNHDVDDVLGGTNTNPKEAGLKQWWINPFKTRFNYLESAGVTTTHTWYYADIVKDALTPERNLRIIVLNEYVDGVYSGFSGSPNKYVRFSEEQLNWLRDTLMSTPAGYGIIICYHGTEMPIVKDGDRGAFWHHANSGNESGAGKSAYAEGNPISGIVDAFISRTSYSINVAERPSSGANEASSTYTITGDFSSRNESTEFIAYLCGHNHSDNIGVLSGTVNRQVSLMIEATNANYGQVYNSGANEHDMPRGKTGSAQDAFNQYVFDRSRGTIRVARIGSNVSRDFVDRKIMEIPYKD